jgi:rod shape-determining protein MreC
MHSLLNFIRKHWFVVLFLLLEVVSMVMISNSYSYHRSLSFNTVNDLTGNVFSAYSNVTEYFALKKANESLLEENARLMSRLKESFLTTDTGFTYKDTLYRYIPAHVVSISINHPANFIMLNKGLLHGVKKEMGVISGNGVAGIIIGVSNHYSLAMSLLHHNSKLSGRIKNNNILVNVIWDTGDYRFGKIQDIPSHVQLVKGDTIVTSGNSLIFPEGIVIGTVEKYENNPNLAFNEATMRFATNFKNLQNVIIIDNLMKEEQQSLLKQENE